MGSGISDNYDIRIRFGKDRRNEEPSLEKVTLNFKGDKNKSTIGWYNKGGHDKPHFYYEALDEAVIGHANQQVGSRGFTDPQYKSEYWNYQDGSDTRASERNTTESGKLFEVTYNISKKEDGTVRSHFYSERTYSMTPDGHGGRTHYNIYDLKNGVEISFNTDGKGNIDKESLKEKPLSEGQKQIFIEKGEAHLQNVRDFYESNTKKEKDLEFDPAKKSGFLDPKKFSDKVGQLSKGLDPEQYAFSNKGITSETLNKGHEKA